MCSETGFHRPAWRDRSRLELDDCLFTCDHGDIAEFVEGVEVENSLKIDASVADAYLIEVVEGFLHAEDDVAELIFCNFFVVLPPVLDLVG